MILLFRILSTADLSGRTLIFAGDGRRRFPQHEADPSLRCVSVSSSLPLHTVFSRHPEKGSNGKHAIFSGRVATKNCCPRAGICFKLVQTRLSELKELTHFLLCVFVFDFITVIFPIRV